jgi:hypothetical protein
MVAVANRVCELVDRAGFLIHLLEKLILGRGRTTDVADWVCEVLVLAVHLYVWWRKGSE